MCALYLPSGFDSLMISYRLSDLALLYQLFSRVKRGQDELCSAFNEYIKVHECISRIKEWSCLDFDDKNLILFSVK